MRSKTLSKKTFLHGVCGPHTTVEDSDRTGSLVSGSKIGFSWSSVSTASAPPGLLGLKTAGSQGSPWIHQPPSPHELIPPKTLSNHASFDFVSLESPRPAELVIPYKRQLSQYIGLLPRQQLPFTQNSIAYLYL